MLYVQDGLVRLIFAVTLSFILFGNVNAYAEQAVPADKWSSELLQLATSENPREFAKKHGITLIDNSVKVIIVTKDKSVEKLVPVESLISLSGEEDVEYIRRPYKFWQW